MNDSPAPPPVRVYKVGGSLFDWPELFERLDALLTSDAGRPLLVAGGGAVADVVRDWDRVHGLGEERSHRLAVASLRLCAAFLVEGLSDAELVSDRTGAERAWRQGRVPVLCVQTFLDAEEATGAEPLPHTWDVTTDSIAAWIAWRWPAELVLLKSSSPQQAETPYVDRHFPIVARRLPQAEWINLRTGERGASRRRVGLSPPSSVSRRTDAE